MKTKFKALVLALAAGNFLLLNLFFLAPQAASAQAPTNQANTVTTCTAQTQFCGTKDVYTPGADGGPGPIAYHGPELSITRLLCTPGQAPATGSAAPDANDLGNCINKLYRAGGAFAAIAGVFFIALAGYLYILGGEKGKEKGKEMFLAVIAGLIIIFTSYILLVQINPQSVRFKTIQPPQLSGIPDKYPECNTIRVQGEQCVISGRISISDGNGGAIGGQQIQGNGVSCSLGDDNRASSHAVCHPEYNTVIAAAAAKYGVDPDAVRTVILQESSWSNRGPSENSDPNKQAWGLMQVTKATANSLGCAAAATTNSASGDSANIDCGTKALKDCLSNRRVNGDLKNAFVCYNAGAGALDPSSICSGLALYQCPFTDSTKTACQEDRTASGGWTYKQTRNYAITAVRWYNEYKQKACSTALRRLYESFLKIAVKKSSAS